MLVDVYEKTRTIEVPDGDKSVKVCKIDLTGLGYSTETKIQHIGSDVRVAIMDDTVSAHIEKLKTSANFQEEKRHDLYNEIRKAFDLFLDTLSDSPIRDKVKRDLIRRYSSCFENTRSFLWGV